jgi:lipoate-protein ligase A
MLCIQSKTDDIFFNLATEEYLLRNTKEDYMMLWRSMPVVVVGKHQNALAEINPEFIRKHKINIARRLSGGGAVYQDPGNINFSFICNGEKGKLVDFKKFLKPILGFLESKSIPAHLGDRNDIIVNNFKVSGNAEHVYKERVLHHGTLLYNSELNALKASLSEKSDRFIDNAIQSNRSNVVNIIDYLEHKLTAKDFMQDLFKFLVNYFTGSIHYEINNQEENEIKELVDSKYSKWEWIFGYSPTFLIKTEIILENIEHILQFKIAKGIIVEADIMKFSSNNKLQLLTKNIIGSRYNYETLKEYFENYDIDVCSMTDLLKMII